MPNSVKMKKKSERMIYNLDRKPYSDWSSKLLKMKRVRMIWKSNSV